LINKPGISSHLCRPKKPGGTVPPGNRLEALKGNQRQHSIEKEVENRKRRLKP